MENRYPYTLTSYSSMAMLIVLGLYSMEFIDINSAIALVVALFLVIAADCSYLRYRWTKKRNSRTRHFKRLTCRGNAAFFSSKLWLKYDIMNAL